MSARRSHEDSSPLKRTARRFLRYRQPRPQYYPSVICFLITWWLCTIRTNCSVEAFPITTQQQKQLTRTEIDLSALEYCSGSSSSKPPVIFLHGLLGNKRNFNSIARSLCGRLKTPRKIIGLDLRNHGDSVVDYDDDMSYVTMALDVIQYMDSNGMQHVELIGHSVGGKVAQAVALLEPERVKGLVVLDIAPVTYTTDEPHWQAVTHILQTLADDSVSDLSKRDMDVHLKSNGVIDPNVRAFCLTNYQEGVGWKIPVDILHSQVNTLAGFDDALQSRQWTGDAFFVHGGQSKFVRSSHLPTISEFFPRHMLTTIRGAGHWVHAEAPEDTTALLQQYLER